MCVDLFGYRCTCITELLPVVWFRYRCTELMLLPVLWFRYRCTELLLCYLLFVYMQRYQADAVLLFLYRCLNLMHYYISFSLGADVPSWWSWCSVNASGKTIDIYYRVTDALSDPRFPSSSPLQPENPAALRGRPRPLCWHHYTVHKGSWPPASDTYDSGSFPYQKQVAFYFFICLFRKHTTINAVTLHNIVHTI